MTKDAGPLLFGRASQFSVGLMALDPHLGARVLGSGVLVSVEGRRGILTCGHVAECYANRSEIGLITVAGRSPQRDVVQLRETETITLGNGPWSEKAADLAVTWLPPETSSSIAAKSSFLDLMQNAQKHARGEPQFTKRADAILGLLDERTDKPAANNGTWVTMIRGLMNAGRIVAEDRGAITFETTENNVPDLPKSFGGTSGGGLWTAFLNVVSDGNYQLAEFRLSGIASWQIDATKIACQANARIEQLLLPEIGGQRK